MHAQGDKIVSCIVTVNTKLISPHLNLGTQATHKHNELKLAKKLALVCFK